VLIMVMSGWRIYNASPIFDFTFPNGITLGGWLGGALQWHFAGMWLFVLNGLAYLLLNLITGRFGRRMLPVSARGILRDACCADGSPMRTWVITTRCVLPTSPSRT
jgi:thiosulfate reductase cytochrome b subunit